jgi:VCBS repeat-containing protein
LDEDGSFVYTADADFFGIDSFTYIAVDVDGEISTGTVRIEVDGSPDAPVAQDFLAEQIGTSISGQLIATDVDGDALTFRLLGEAQNGTLVLNEDGSLSYTPDDGFVGLEQIDYIVEDGTGLADTGTITLVTGQTLQQAQNQGGGQPTGPTPDFGFVLNGIDVDDESGFSVSAIGDINDDGIDDILISAPSADPTTIVFPNTPQNRAGEAYVVFGGPNVGTGPDIELSALNGTDGFVLVGYSANDAFGYSASGVGDMNNDGIDDVVLAAPFADPFGVLGAGQGYLVFGDPNIGSSGVFDVGTFNGNNGIFINGVDQADQAGISISGLGDVDGDGIDDLIIGAHFADGVANGASLAGESYIIFGNSNLDNLPNFPFSSITLSPVVNADVLFLNGIDVGDRSGTSVSSAGDFDGDGIDDILIGAPFADANLNTLNNAGATYVIYGASTLKTAGNLNLSALSGMDGFVINGANTNDRAGQSVSYAGDFNGDGIDDILIGAPGSSSTVSGQAFVVFGGQGTGGTGSFDLSALGAGTGVTFNGIDPGDQAGFSVSSAGDVNGDGIDDILIGAFNAGPNGAGSGETYLVFGSTSFTTTTTFNLSSLNGTNGYIINGIDGLDNAGTSVSSAGDVNGDGIDDLLIGADRADPNGNSIAGESYVIWGGSADLSAFDANDGSQDGVLELSGLIA